MQSRPPITPQQIAAYLRGESDKRDRQHIGKIRKEEPVYQLLFDLIDDLKNRAIIREQPGAAKFAPSFSEVEEILMCLFAGAAQPEVAQQFIDGLLFSPQFYQRLLVKLAAATPQSGLEEVPEIAQIRVKPDEEILAEVLAGAEREQRVKTAPNHEAALPPLTSLWDNLRRLFESPRRVPRYAFALVTIVAGILVGLFIYEKAIHKERYEYYVYENRLPYEYDTSSLRSSSTVLAEDPQFRSYVNQFKLGMSDYLVRDYDSAIRVLEKLEPAALALRAGSAGVEFLPWHRDLYFYLGLSHLALSSHQKLTREDKAQHLDAAIHFLARAQSLALTNRLEGNDRETYFLGLAYGLGGHQDSAVVQLQKIESGSRFYNDSVKLINKWSNE